MKFVDEAYLTVQAGKGGNGSRSFRREKFIPFGGPDGGDGGRGGDIYLKGDSGLNTLVDFRTIRQVKAMDGDVGRGNQRTGYDGEDKVVSVPVGTVVFDADTDELIGDVEQPGELLLVAKGGAKGLGNVHFKSSTNRAPRKTIPGKLGETRKLRLELKLLADVGLLGLPNAGKSTLLRAISAATPKVADYPFTTLYPHLGTVSVGVGRSFVVADIPGLIEGASKGQGLGHAFLRHLSRNRLLLHLVDIAPMDGSSPMDSIKIIEQELKEYSPELVDKPRWLVFTKIDQLPLDTRAEEIQKIQEEVKRLYPEQTKVFFISAVAREGLKELCYEMQREVEERRALVEVEESSALLEFEV